MQRIALFLKEKKRFWNFQVTSWLVNSWFSKFLELLPSIAFDERKNLSLYLRITSFWSVTSIKRKSHMPVLFDQIVQFTSYPSIIDPVRCLARSLESTYLIKHLDLFGHQSSLWIYRLKNMTAVRLVRFRIKTLAETIKSRECAMMSLL